MKHFVKNKEKIFQLTLYHSEIIQENANKYFIALYLNNNLNTEFVKIFKLNSAVVFILYSRMLYIVDKYFIEIKL